MKYPGNSLEKLGGYTRDRRGIVNAMTFHHSILQSHIQSHYRTVGYVLRIRSRYSAVHLMTSQLTSALVSFSQTTQAKKLPEYQRA